MMDYFFSSDYIVVKSNYYYYMHFVIMKVALIAPQTTLSAISTLHLLIGISVCFIICMLTLLLMPLTGLHFCGVLYFVTPSNPF
jgi:hypothetical protein